MSAYDEAKKKHEASLLQYNERLQHYITEKSSFDKLIETLKSQEDILNYRLQQRKKFLMESKPKDRFRNFFNIDGPKNPKMGRAEYFFKDYLAKALRNNLIPDGLEFYFDTSIMLIGKLGHKVNFFYPDIMFITPRGLLIDVEIDEPYIAETKKPIHYINFLEGSDYNRNQFFTNSNCSVIRFSERQIIKYPKVCLDIILAFDDNACIPQDMLIPQDFYEESWTKNDAIRMASEDYRNTY